MQKFEQFITGSNLEKIIPWTVMSNETEKEYKIFLPDGNNISISPENAKWLRAQLNSIR